MTPKQLRDTIATIGITQEELGKFLGHPTGRTVRRWIAGDSPVPVAVSKLLKLMIELELKPSDIP